VITYVMVQALMVVMAYEKEEQLKIVKEYG
jgi:hypothetical protein